MEYMTLTGYDPCHISEKDIRADEASEALENIRDAIRTAVKLVADAVSRESGNIIDQSEYIALFEEDRGIIEKEIARLSTIAETGEDD